MDGQFYRMLRFIDYPGKEHQAAIIEMPFWSSGVRPAFWVTVLYYDAICIGLTVPFGYCNLLPRNESAKRIEDRHGNKKSHKFCFLVPVFKILST